jgi:hypothetical protein
MYRPVGDKELAEQALKALRSINTSARDRALVAFDELRIKIAPTVQDHERADAWLAVCHICEALKPGGTGNVTALHADGIRKTEIWLRSFD